MTRLADLTRNGWTRNEVGSEFLRTYYLPQLRQKDKPKKKTCVQAVSVFNFRIDCTDSSVEDRSGRFRYAPASRLPRNRV